jgi:Leucine-rich repeat (LRR) protein
MTDAAPLPLPPVWPRSVDEVGEHDGSDRLSLHLHDLSPTATQGAKKKAIAEACARLPGLTGVRALKLWTHVTPPLFEAACRMPQLEALVIKWSNLRDLAPIRALPRLRYLWIGSSTRIESIEPLAGLATLEWLELENFKAISDFSPLVALRSLHTLAVTGSLWTRQDVGSLEPFARMTSLRSLMVDTSRVRSLRPLAALSQLETLGIGGRLPMAEYAWLAGRLRDTQCRWFHPWLDVAGSGIGRCSTCGNDSMVMLTGKGAPIVCRLCAAGAVARHEAAFEAVRSAAAVE